MSMSKRRESQQQEMWVPISALPEAPGHPFYTQLNKLLAAHGFDLFVEELVPRITRRPWAGPVLRPGSISACS